MTKLFNDKLYGEAEYYILMDPEKGFVTADKESGAAYYDTFHDMSSAMAFHEGELYEFYDDEIAIPVHQTDAIAIKLEGADDPFDKSQLTVANGPNYLAYHVEKGFIGPDNATVGPDMANAAVLSQEDADQLYMTGEYLMIGLTDEQLQTLPFELPKASVHVDTLKNQPIDSKQTSEWLDDLPSESGPLNTTVVVRHPDFGFVGENNVFTQELSEAVGMTKEEAEQYPAEDYERIEYTPEEVAQLPFDLKAPHLTDDQTLIQ